MRENWREQISFSQEKREKVKSKQVDGRLSGTHSEVRVRVYEEDVLDCISSNFKTLYRKECTYGQSHHLSFVRLNLASLHLLAFRL